MNAKTTRQISAKATRDLRNSGAILGGLMVRSYVIESATKPIYVSVKAGQTSENTQIRIMRELVALGWFISSFDGYGWTMNHPSFTESN